MHPTRKDAQSYYYETPNLDRLASEGVRFSRAYASGPLCSPSRHAIQYGQTPADELFWAPHLRQRYIYC
jgi:arylsulfatase A-like enzyme